MLFPATSAASIVSASSCASGRQSLSFASSAADSEAGASCDFASTRRFSARIVACGSAIAYFLPPTSKVTSTIRV